MNYLAHAYLSFNDPDLLAGNMISDYIKGKKQFDYPEKILAGIKLHRAIDDFTDTHAATAKIKEFFRPAYRLYSGAFTDVVYDYFLANDKDEFANEQSLLSFTEKTFSLLDTRVNDFPEKFAAMYPYMKAQNWLYNYRLNDGIQKSFGGLARRASYIAETETAFYIFLSKKDEIKFHYDSFFKEVKSFAAHKAEQLLPK